MKITLELPDTMIGGFLNGVIVAKDGLHLMSSQLDTEDLTDGNTIKIPREADDVH